MARAFEVVSLDGQGNGTDIVKLPKFGNVRLGVVFENLQVVKGGCVIAIRAVLNNVGVSLLNEQLRRGDCQGAE